MVKKTGRRGEFLACSAYPKCKNAKPLNPTPQKPLKIKCPECGGEILQRNSRRGAFFGCGNYPKCTFVSKYEPIADPKCPECGYMMAQRTYRGKEICECIKCKTKVEK